MTNQYVSQPEQKVAKSECQFPINRTYTFDQTKYKSSQYLEFDTPYDWVSSRSVNKCISLRRCQIIPYSCDIIVNINTEIPKGIIQTAAIIPEDDDTLTVSFNLSISPEDSTHKIISVIVNTFNSEINDWFEKHDRIDSAVMTYSYSDNGDLIFSLNYRENEGAKYASIDFGFESDTYTHLNKVFNQPEESQVLMYSMKGKTLHNVWDRQHIYVHSSISDDYMQLLCENNVKYGPKKYLYPSSHNTIRIWFTRDMKNIIPIYNLGTLILKFSYIFNYRTAAV